MFDYLAQRDLEEKYRTSVRELEFPDGVKRKIEAYRLVWDWYDRTLAYTFAPDADEILESTLHVAELNNMDLGEALGWVVDDYAEHIEKAGGDYTDDNLELLVAKRAMDRFHSKKKSG